MRREPSWLQQYGQDIPAVIRELVMRGAIFICNHSGGKDSQAMYHFLRKIVPDSQIRVIHAVLAEVEWEGLEDHIRNTIDHELETCSAGRKLLEIVERRRMFPSPRMRFCTSDLKRNPIEKAIRHTGKKLIVNCMGMRAQESSGRAKLDDFKLSTRNSKAGREWYDWLPIHAWKEEEVFAMIAHVGQRPLWVYEKGMRRASCCLCVMSSREDLTTAAKLNPALYKRYVELERSIGQVMIMPTKARGRLSLEQITGVMAG